MKYIGTLFCAPTSILSHRKTGFIYHTHHRMAGKLKKETLHIYNHSRGEDFDFGFFCIMFPNSIINKENFFKKSPVCLALVVVLY